MQPVTSSRPSTARPQGFAGLAFVAGIAILGAAGPAAATGLSQGAAALNGIQTDTLVTEVRAARGGGRVSGARVSGARVGRVGAAGVYRGGVYRRGWVPGAAAVGAAAVGAAAVGAAVTAPYGYGYGGYPTGYGYPSGYGYGATTYQGYGPATYPACGYYPYPAC